MGQTEALVVVVLVVFVLDDVVVGIVVVVDFVDVESVDDLEVVEVLDGVEEVEVVVVDVVFGAVDVAEVVEEELLVVDAVEELDPPTTAFFTYPAELEIGRPLFQTLVPHCSNGWSWFHRTQT